MRNQIAPALTILTIAIATACGGTEPADQTPSDAPQGEVSDVRSGVIVHQDGPDTSGTVKVVKDEAERRFVQLGSDFKSDFATGTVTLYLAKSDANLDQQRAADPNSVSDLIAPLDRNGEQYHKLPDGVSDAGFDYAVFWCNTAKINFGAAKLQ